MGDAQRAKISASRRGVVHHQSVPGGNEVFRALESPEDHRSVSLGPSREQLDAERRRRYSAMGYPRRLPCLRCGRPRLAEHPGDRMHRWDCELFA